MTDQQAEATARGNAAVDLWRRIGPFLKELALVAILYGIYSVLRSASPDRESLAMRHADDVERTQRALGIDIESGLNGLFVRNQWIADFGSYWYQTMHMLAVIILLVWMWRRRKADYKPMRTGLALVMLGGLATYWLYPLAPPRFALEGAVDTMALKPLLFWGENVTGLSNVYAAMPSLHVGFAVWCAIVVVMLNTSPWRHLAWLYPMTTMFVVVGTANHYVLDGVAGTVLAFIGVAVSRAIYGRRGVAAAGVAAEA